jgi:hypothetical protein
VTIAGHEASVRGRLIRIAGLAAEGYTFVDDSDAVHDEIQAQRRRIDLFTFTQEASESARRYAHHREGDKVAAMAIWMYTHWRTRQIKDKTRNMLRRADKAGLILRPVSFDDALVRGIATVYNEWPIRQGRRFRARWWARRFPVAKATS